MAASPSVLRHSQQSTRTNAQSSSHNPSSSPVPPVALKTSTPHRPSLNIIQGPPPLSSSTKSFPSTLSQLTGPPIEQYNRHKAPFRSHITTSQTSSRPLRSNNSTPSNSTLLAGNLHYSLSESSANTFSPIPKMLSSKSSTHGCLPLTSPLAPPSLVDTSVSAPPPSTSQSSRKKAKTRLHLSALPRFPQPPSNTASPPPPPNSMMNMNAMYQYNTQAYVTAQQQLQYYQKDLIQQATRGSLPSHLLFPVSPRLIPLGSPGPVTPLTLEESSGGYLTASSTSSSSPGSSIDMPFIPQREMDKLTAIAAAQT